MNYIFKMLALTILVVATTLGVRAHNVWHDMVLLEDEKNIEAKPVLKSEFVYMQLLKNNPIEVKSLNQTAFKHAFTAFANLKSKKYIHEEQSIVTICDFTLSGNQKRMWIIDINEAKVISHNLVSHGKNTGEEFAVHFSNKPNSYQSSLGVYLTGATYDGSNGYSLKLIGMDKGLNDKAEERAIVLHGAAYCSEDFIKEHGRLGRSYGCPSVPVELNEKVINTIKDQSVFYIFQDGNKALDQSVWIKS